MHKIKWFSLSLSVALLLAVAALSCSQATPNTTATMTDTAIPGVQQAKSLNGAGATFPQPLYTKWFDEYSRLTGVKINYQGVGSGGGIKAVTDGTVDFGAS